MNKAHSRTSIFLMELIIAVLLFALASAVCVQLFVNTHIRGERTRELNFAVTEAQSLVEIARTTADDFGAIDRILKETYETAISSDTDSSYTAQIFYDKEFKVCPAADAFYTANLSVVRDDAYNNISVYILKEVDKTVYSIQTKKYRN